MKIAIISSNGIVTRKIIDVAKEWKLSIIGFLGNENKSNVMHFVKKCFWITKSVLEELDVVDAFGVWDLNKMD